MRSSNFFWALIACITCLTVAVTLFEVPEEQVVTSADGVVTVAGAVREIDAISVVADDAVALPIMSAYRLDPSDSIFDVPVLVTFRVDGLGLEGGATVYWYNNQTSMWEVLDAQAEDASTITLQTSQLGRFGVGYAQVVDAPVFLTTYDELRQRAPQGTRGYDISVGYSVDGAAVVALPSEGERGGCGGVVGQGLLEERSMMTAQAMTLVDDVQTQVTYTFLARWFVDANGKSCPEGAPLLPLVVRDILSSN